MNRSRKKPVSSRVWTLAIPALVTLLTGVTLLVVRPAAFMAWMQRPEHPVEDTTSHFSDLYPVANEYQIEMKQLLDSGEVEKKNEELIHGWTTAVAHDLHMPASLLWCLFFQESRLNHLSGSKTPRPAKGLGQFLRPTFFEVNHHLDRYTAMNSEVMEKRMGRDIRPVAAKRTKTFDVSSYYYIPTAVLSSATYLNNRYHQLNKNLVARGITPNSDILWLYSIMAYNKGTRSVLSFWNDAYRKGGIENVRTLVTDFSAFHAAVQRRPSLKRALGKIWPKPQAERYATELSIHINNIGNCALTPEAQKQRYEAKATPQQVERKGSL